MLTAASAPTLRSAVPRRVPTRWWRTAATHVRLARPADNFFAFAGTVLGAGLAGVHEPAAAVLSLATSNALLSAASMIANDCHDVACDAINSPRRPIPAGLVSRERARVMAACCFVSAVVAAAFAGWTFAFAAVAVTGASLWYTRVLKGTPIVGNAMIGLLSGYPLWCWAVRDGHRDVVWLGAAAGFVIAGTGREILRTVADMAGDGAVGIETVATRYGGARANRTGYLLVIAGLLVARVAAGASPNHAYLAALDLSGVAMLGVGAYCLAVLSPRDASRRLTFVARALTAALAVGVAWDFTRWPTP